MRRHRLCECSAPRHGPDLVLVHAAFDVFGVEVDAAARHDCELGDLEVGYGKGCFVSFEGVVGGNVGTEDDLQVAR